MESIFQIGKSSLTTQSVDAIKAALKARELVKINVLKNCDDDVNEIATVGSINRAEFRTLLLLLNPFAPHITEELWQQLGETGLLSVAPWPTYDEAKTVESTVELAVQVNGKLKCTIKLAADADKQTAIDTAMAEEKVQHAIEGKQIVKQIVVPGKIVNLVVK